MNKNKITLMILAILACIIWTYIAIRLLRTSCKAELPAENTFAKTVVASYDLQSLSMTPFKMPEVNKKHSKQIERQNVPRKKAANKHQGRYIGTIESSDVSLIIVEIDGIYRYVDISDFTGDCRVIRKFDNDSVIVTFCHDTLTLYKNGRLQ